MNNRLKNHLAAAWPVATVAALAGVVAYLIGLGGCAPSDSADRASDVEQVAYALNYSEAEAEVTRQALIGYPTGSQCALIASTTTGAINDLNRSRKNSNPATPCIVNNPAIQDAAGRHASYKAIHDDGGCAANGTDASAEFAVCQKFWETTSQARQTKSGQPASAAMIDVVMTLALSPPQQAGYSDRGTIGKMLNDPIYRQELFRAPFGGLWVAVGRDSFNTSLLWRNDATVLSMATPVGSTQPPSAYMIWPEPGGQNVSRYQWGLHEVPMPDPNGGGVGYAISYQGSGFIAARISRMVGESGNTADQSWGTIGGEINGGLTVITSSHPTVGPWVHPGTAIWYTPDPMTPNRRYQAIVMRPLANGGQLTWEFRTGS